MSMNSVERATKNWLVRKLMREGYVTYSKLLSEYHLNITDHPKVIGFMSPSEGTITINHNLDQNQASVVIRHEILHFYLKHEERMLKHLAVKKGLDYSALLDSNLEELKDELYRDDTFNYAADYEISNRAYTDRDKIDIRNIFLNGELLSGLVTEDKHPDWINLPVEEMYDRLAKERDRTKEEIRNDIKRGKGSKKASGSSGKMVKGTFVDSTTFLDANGEVVTFE